jgi:hypothetical protein
MALGENTDDHRNSYKPDMDRLDRLSKVSRIPIVLSAFMLNALATPYFMPHKLPWLPLTRSRKA